MRSEIKKFIRSGEKVILLPRDYSTDMISQWISVRNVLRPPINWILVGFSKFIPHSRWTASFYRVFLGMKIGSKVGLAQINPDFIIPELIEIGDNSSFGWKVTILTHEFTQTYQRFGRVIIGKNVLVGGYSIIRSGISIGDNSVISPNSVVVCDVPPNEIWGGNPAIKIRNNRVTKVPIKKSIVSNIHN